MMSMPIAIEHADKKRVSAQYIVKFDAETLERLAGICGWFHPDFLASVERAENDIRAKRVKPLRSFRDLRTK